MTIFDFLPDDSRSDDRPHACAGEHCQVCAADRLKGKPVLPYGGTSGWSGTNTSRDRAVTADETGVTGERQSRVIELLAEKTTQGVTWKDVAGELNVHHGTASGVLSVLHKVGLIARLNETRDRCKIYVLPEYVDGRECETQGRSHECPNCGHRF